MFTEEEKLVIKNIITEKRPDLEKQLLNTDCYIYQLLKDRFDTEGFSKVNEDSIREVWSMVNLDSPIPDLTAEIDVIIENHFLKTKMELRGLGMYQDVLNTISESADVLAVYDKYKYFDTAKFAYSDEFDKELELAIHNSLEKIEIV